MEKLVERLATAASEKQLKKFKGILREKCMADKRSHRSDANTDGQKKQSNGKEKLVRLLRPPLPPSRETGSGSTEEYKSATCSTTYHSLQTPDPSSDLAPTIASNLGAHQITLTKSSINFLTTSDERTFGKKTAAPSPWPQHNPTMYFKSDNQFGPVDKPAELKLTVFCTNLR